MARNEFMDGVSVVLGLMTIKQSLRTCPDFYGAKKRQSENASTRTQGKKNFKNTKGEI